MKTVLLLLLVCAGIKVNAQKTDTITFAGKMLSPSLLKPGKEQYAVYSYSPSGAMGSLRIWTRDISYEKRGATNMLVIRGQSNGADTIGLVNSYSLVDAANFKPVFHRITSTKLGNSAYNFYDDKITGADTVAANRKKDFTLTTPLPYNWDLDMEMIRILPFADKRQFAINWYQPGTPAAKYYLHQVTGSASLTTPDNHKVDCWMVQLTYSPDSYAVFFVSKKSRELLKVEQYRNGKLVRLKLRLAVTGS